MLFSRSLSAVIVMVLMSAAYVGYFALLTGYEKKESNAYVRGIELAMEFESKQYGNLPVK